MKKKKDDEFVLTWAFTFTVKGGEQTRADFQSHTLTDATLQFHASRQIEHGLGRDDYKIIGIKTNHQAPQSYDQYDLPPRNPDIRQCMFTKKLFNRHQEKLAELGWLGVSIA